MNALRQFVTSGDGVLTIQLPDEYSRQKLEVIILPMATDVSETEMVKDKMDLFLATLATNEPDISPEEIISDIRAIRQERYDRSKN